MSADTPSSETKYSTGRSKFLTDNIALTDHAIHRYRQRTPHDHDVSIQTAWQRGEAIRHPAVASKKSEHNLEQVRVYQHAHEWGVAFLVVQDTHDIDSRPEYLAAKVVATVVDLAGFEHGPSRAYLHSHGPHYDPDVSSGGDSA